MGVVRAKVQEPIIEVLEQREYAVLYRERTDGGVSLVHRHYLGCDDFMDIIYISDDGFLYVYHVHGRHSEDYLKLFLDGETAEQIRKEIMDVKAFDDFNKLFEKLLKTQFCEGKKSGQYRICP